MIIGMAATAVVLSLVSAVVSVHCWRDANRAADHAVRLADQLERVARTAARVMFTPDDGSSP